MMVSGYLVSLGSHSGSQTLFKSPRRKLQSFRRHITDNHKTSLLLQSLHHAKHLNPAQIQGKTSSLMGRSSTDAAVIFDLPQRSVAHLCQCSPRRQISGEPEATGCLLLLCTLLIARNLISKSGPIFFSRKKDI